jgi:hypothetical protein
MGCDIHFYVEREVNGSWVGAQCPQSTLPSWSSEKRRSSWYLGRSYILFGVLAGVRSNWLPTPIKVRGMPDKVSPLIKKEADKWKGDAHSHSYITLEELICFETLTAEQSLYLNLEDYRSFKKDRNNFYLTKGLFEPKEENIISVEEMERVSNLIAFSNDDKYKQKYVKITDQFPLVAFIKEFWDQCIPEMKKLHKDPSKVRCVFWFDN